MNGSIKREIRQREFLLDKARRYNLDEDWSTYRRSRTRVTKLVRDSKSKYSRELIDENSDDPKKFWKTVKKIMPGQKAKRVTNIDVNGTQIYDDKEIANSFNNLFTKTLPSTQSFKFLMSGPSYTFRFEEVSVDFIRDQLKKLKAKKAVGLDQLPARLLKNSAEIIAKPLTTLINASLIYGYVPSEWKWARENPLFKNGKSNDMDNYRPISVLPTISKVLERVVHMQLYDCLAREKLLIPYQCGFRKGLFY